MQAPVRRTTAVAALHFVGIMGLALLLDLQLRSIPTATTAPTTSPLLIGSALAAPRKAPSATDIPTAVQLIKKGKVAKATALLNRAISSGKLKTSDMARALHYRGIALRKQGKPAQAIADFTNAMWLKNGLSASLRKEAGLQRAAAYKEAAAAGTLARRTTASVRIPPGTARRTAAFAPAKQPAARVVRPAGGGWQTRTRGQARGQPRGLSVATTRQSAAANKPKPSFISNVGGFFSNLFSSSKKTAKPSAAAAPQTALANSQRPSNPGHLTEVSSWNSRTSVKSAGKRTAARRTAARNRVPRRTRVATARRTAVAARKRTAGKRRSASYRLILSPVRSPEVAKANATRLKTQFAGQLAQRQPVIETTTFGGGTFYQVRIGPFADASAPQSICAKLKAGGIDCMLARR